MDLKEKRIQLEDKIVRFRGALADKRDEALARWDEMSRYFAAGFMELFTGGGAIVSEHAHFVHEMHLNNYSTDTSPVE